jgi:hypothetical protein
VRALPATVLSRCQIVRFAARARSALAEDLDTALSVLEETRAKGPEALFRRVQSVDRERAEALVDAEHGLRRHAKAIGRREGLSTEMTNEELLKRGDIHMGTPDEVAAAVAFLASEEAAYVTGETLGVSGGLGMV